MKPAGLEAFEKRTEENSGIYSYDRPAPLALTAGELKAFRKNKAAWKYFETVAPGYRKTVTHWIASAKREDTRARRLARLIESCAAGVRLTG